MGTAAILLCLKLCPLALVLGHAFFEARAAHKYVEPAPVLPGAPQSFSLLWLVSAVAFFLYELFTIYAAFSLTAISTLLAAGCASGIALFACGTLLRLAAIKELRAAFNQPPWAAAEVSLASGGVFAMVRHPSELGTALMCLGLALATGSPAAFAICGAVLLPLMLLRIRQEEVWLRQKTHGAYAKYAAAVSCICPSFRFLYDHTKLQGN
ncbi:MAG: methyltransferase family protein [Rhodomicrobium sp.]